MTVPEEVVALFGWRGGGAPNIADKDSPLSLAIASALFERLGVTRESSESGQTLGSNFEAAIADFIRSSLVGYDRPFEVGRHVITAFAQYRHLARLEQVLTESDPEGVIRAELGGDYLIKPDVTVGLRSEGRGLYLHAAISCKWTIRSDRVQNIRHEGVILGRHRRGRQPHIVTVTCEPLPTRLAAIARGTGEVDCVYHVALDEIMDVMSMLDQEGRFSFSSELDVLMELRQQDRLRPLDVLPEILRFV